MDDTDKRIVAFAEEAARAVKSDRVRISALEKQSVEYFEQFTSQIEANRASIVQADGRSVANKKRIDNIMALMHGATYVEAKDSSVAYTKLVGDEAITGGAELMPYAGVKSIGGKTLVWNQLLNYKNKEVAGNEYFAEYSNIFSAISGHKYLLLSNIKSTVSYTKPYSMYINGNLFFNNGDKKIIIGTNIFYDFIVYTGSSSNKLFYFYPNSSADGIGYEDAAGTTLTITAQCFDLTLMFGAGNEPATVEEFEAMFPAEFYDYDPGTLKSAAVTEVVSHGNLFEAKDFAYTPDVTISLENGVYSFIRKSGLQELITDTIPLSKPILPGTYTLSLFNNATPSVVLALRGEGNKILYELGFWKGINASATFTVKKKIVGYSLYFPANHAVNTTCAPCITQGTKGVSAFIPYTPPVYLPIPAAVQNLPGYGWSAGTAKNWIDWENKVYHREVGKVDFSADVRWYIFKPENTAIPPMFMKYYSTDAVTTLYNNIVCNKYKSANSWDMTHSDIDKCISIISDNNKANVIRLRDTAYTDLESFNATIEGIEAYYALATPELIDISDLLPEDNLIEVEAGGVLTFKNALGADFCIPVPSDVTYTLKLVSEEEPA